MQPDYYNSIVNLMSSLRQGLAAGDTIYPPLDLLSPTVVAEADHIVLWIVDGLGYHYLCRHSTVLREYLQGSIGSVFPSSTAPAMTSFHTAVAPQQHAVTGWYMYLQELAAITMILPFKARGIEPLPRILRPTLADLVDTGPFTQGLVSRNYLVVNDQLRDTRYSKAMVGNARRLGYADLWQCVSCVGEIVHTRGGRKYIHAYWPEYDALAHTHGVGSQAVTRHFVQIEEAFVSLLDALSGSNTLLLVTADHGFVDHDPALMIDLERHPYLQDCLLRPLCGEPRVAYCYLKPARKADFPIYIADTLGDHLDCYPSEQLVAQGWFGMGTPSEHLLRRLGDYVLIPKGQGVIIDRIDGERPWSMIGVHGGLSEEEMLVPLIVARC